MGKTPAPSASLLVLGFIGTSIGGVLNVVGTTANAAEVVSRYSSASHPGTGWIVFGAIIGLMGLIALVSGFYNLASGVDYLVRRAAPQAPTGAPRDASTEAA